MSTEKEIFNLSQSQENFVFLYDAKKTAYSTGESIFAYDLDSQIKAKNLGELERSLSPNSKYFGYFSYDLKDSLESLETVEKESYISDYANINFAKFSHEKRVNNLNFTELTKNFTSPKITELKTNFSEAEYLEKVKEVQNHIKNGDVYQANLTMKYFAEFEHEPNYFLLFLKLIELNPVPFAAFFKFKDFYIISASPELFFRVTKGGEISTCPIKGTSKTTKTEELKTPKETAENLMITDLMRNDLSRICKPSSVQVQELFSKEDFTEYSHLYSNITGDLQQNLSVEQLVSAIFPPGSMTGAPKISAMEICSKLEGQKRGIYSGCLGYLETSDAKNQIKTAEFSVIIRTLICDGKKFEFQVGGGITYDSIPDKEYQETRIKAKPILDILGL